jgi:arabinogalactan oligomer/maltooligosaccharide transport system permease protein
MSDDTPTDREAAPDPPRPAAARVGLRRVVLALVVVVAFVCLTFARRGVAPDSAVRVVVWHSQRGAEKDTLEALLHTFNERHAGRIWAEPLAVPDSSFKDKVLRTVPRGGGPDLFLRPHNELGELLRDDVLAPLEPASLPVPPERHLPGLCEGVSRGGVLYGAPITFKALVLFYDRRVYPDGPPRELDTLLADRQRPHPLVYDATSFFFHAPFYLAAGGTLDDAAGVPSPFDGPGAATFAQPKEWKARGLLPADIGYNDAVRLFEEGSASTLLNGPWYTPPKGAEGHVGVAPLPTVAGKPMGSLVTVEAVFVARSTKHPEEARELLAFLVSPEAAALRREKLGLPLPFPAEGGGAGDSPSEGNASGVGAPRAASREGGPGGLAPTGGGAGDSPSENAQTQSLLAGRVTPSGVGMAAVWRPADEVLRASLRGDDVDAAVARARETLAKVDAPRPPPEKPVGLGVALTVLLAFATWLLVRRVRLDASAPEAARSRLLGNYGTGAIPFLIPGIVSTALLVLVPAVVAALMSFFEYTPSSSGGAGFVYVGLANFEEIVLPSWDRAFEARSFYFALGVTILWTFVNVVLHLSLGVALALCLRPAWVRMRSFFRVLLVLPWAIPNYITALMWKGMFHAQVGAINALLAPFGFEGYAWFNEFHTAFFANVITNTWLGFPFMMVVTLGALTSIPKEVEEAATLDGASRYQRFTLVLFPYLRPALVPSVILGSVWTFNMFNVVYLVSGGEPASQTDILISEAYRWAFERGQRFGYAAAYSVLIFAFLLLYGRVTQRVTEGAT